MEHQLSIVPGAQPPVVPGVPPVGAQPPTVAPQGQPQATPPSPEEMEQRKVGWRGFFQRLKTDESLRQMLFTMGTQLMQPLPARQSSAGHVGKALQAGNQARLQVESSRAAGAVSSRGLAIKQQTADAATSKAAVGKGPAAEVQVLNLLADAKVKKAAAEGATLSREQALLDAEEDRRTKSAAELISPLLPFLAFTQDPAENQRMLQAMLTALRTISDDSTTAPPPPAGGGKVQVWDEKLNRFVVQ